MATLSADPAQPGHRRVRPAAGRQKTKGDHYRLHAQAAGHPQRHRPRRDRMGNSKPPDNNRLSLGSTETRPSLRPDPANRQAAAHREAVMMANGNPPEAQRAASSTAPSTVACILAGGHRNGEVSRNKKTVAPWPFVPSVLKSASRNSTGGYRCAPRSAVPSARLVWRRACHNDKGRYRTSILHTNDSRCQERHGSRATSPGIGCALPCWL